MSPALVAVPCNVCHVDEATPLGTVRMSPLGTTSTLVRCRHCGLAYISPRHSSEEERAFYRQRYYEVTEEDKEVWSGQRLELFRRLLWGIERRRPVGRLLDVGCGRGHFLQVARDGGWDVLGIELAHSARTHAQHVLGLPVLEGELMTVPVPLKSFDVAVAWNVVDQVYEPVPALRRMLACLKPGGLMVLRVPNLAFHWRLHRLWPDVVRCLPALLRYSEPTVFHLTMFTPRTVTAVLRKLGCAKVRVTNSPLDLYVEDLVHLLGRRTTAVLQRGLYGAAQLLYGLSAGRWILGPSLVVWAEKPTDARA